MRNKFLIVLLTFFLSSNSFAENISIVAKNISFDKDKNITIFEDEVVVKTKNKTISSEYAKYNKKLGLLILKKNIIVIDDKNNKVETEYAEYYEKKQLLTTKGETRINTTDNYILNGEDITVDNENKSIISNKSSILIDNDGNEIFLENFEYLYGKNLFKSVGQIKINDKNENVYQFFKYI